MGKIHDGGSSLRIWANSEKILSFSNFWVKKQVFQLSGSHPHMLTFFWDTRWRKFLHFWIFHGNLCILRHYRSISSKSGWSKSSKTPWKSPCCHLLHQQGVLLGERSFGGSNELQIYKFHLGWIVNIQGFPTSYHELNLDAGKCLKIRMKGALPTQFRGATHLNFWLNFQLPAQNFGQLGPVLLVDEIFGFSWCKLMVYM